MPKKKTSSHYINNERFFNELLEWKKEVKEARESGETIPPVTSYIGSCFMEIANNLAKKPNFINYAFKEEMIGDAIENCLLYCENFDPTKSENPFSYFTQITYYAFLRRIQKEKKQNYIKYKYLQSMDSDGDFSEYLKLLGINEEEIVSYKAFESPEKNNIKKKKTPKSSIEDNL